MVRVMVMARVRVMVMVRMMVMVSVTMVGGGGVLINSLGIRKGRHVRRPM